MNAPISYFDQSAATWDTEPRRIELMRAVGAAILREAQPARGMDILDYGCGTGLVGLFLLPYVRSVTGADSSPGMLDVLNRKIRDGQIEGMQAIRLDLEHDLVPPSGYHMVVSSMVMHHVANLDRVLHGFYEMLKPGGILCLADLDTEPGNFHAPEAAESVHHHGFDRTELKAQLGRLGFTDTRDVTAHAMRKPIEGGQEREFPVFLIVARRP